MTKISKRISVFDIFPEGNWDQNENNTSRSTDEAGGDGFTTLPVEEAAVVISTVTEQQNRDAPGCEAQESSEEKPPLCSLHHMSRILVAFSIILSIVAASLSILLLLQYFYQPVVQRACPDFLELCASSSNCSHTDGANLCPPDRQPSNRTVASEYRNPVLLLTGRSLLQLYSTKAGHYFTVCHQGWRTSLGWTVCRELGFNSDTMLSSPASLNATDTVCLESFAVVNNTMGSPSNLEALLSPVDICPAQEGVSLHCTDCGRSTSEPQRIVGGSPSAWGRWPWNVSLRWDGRHVCGGSIISSQWVMSAAHCFVLSNMLVVGRWKVHAGSNNLNPSISVAISSIYYNGLYSPETNDYDLALIKTSQPMAFSETLRPVCLPRTQQQFQATGNCWISGWGHVSEGGEEGSCVCCYNGRSCLIVTSDRFALHCKSSPKADICLTGQVSPVLREAKVNLISRKLCNQSSHYPGMISERMMCAGYLDGKVDSCQGDSGGPLVCQEGGLWWQVGIVSWGEGCGRPNRPGVYTNLTTLLDWVYHRLQTDSEIP